MSPCQGQFKSYSLSICCNFKALVAEVSKIRMQYFCRFQFFSSSTKRLTLPKKGGIVLHSTESRVALSKKREFLGSKAKLARLKAAKCSHKLTVSKKNWLCKGKAAPLISKSARVCSLSLVKCCQASSIRLASSKQIKVSEDI